MTDTRDTPDPRPPVGVIRRLIRRMAGGNLAARLMLVVMVVLTVLILTSPTRTIQLQARTLSAEVQILGAPLEWNLDGAIVCEPSLNRDVGSDTCGDMATPSELQDTDVEWLLGQRLLIDWTPEILRISMLPAEEDEAEGDNWGPENFYVLTHEQARANGALAFVGLLTLGMEINAGATGYVLEGDYSIYEKGLLARFLTWTRLVRDWSPDITRTGKIGRGDEVRIVCQNRWQSECGGQEIEGKLGFHATPVSGSITISELDDVGMHVVALGEEADSLLELSYLGRSEPILVRPNWVQRAAASSGLLALSLLFSLIAPLLLPVLGKRKE